MIQKEFHITNTSGLHTRPGNDFVKTAKQFSSEITLTKGEKTVDAKSLLQVMKTNIVHGDTVSIACSGPDEEEALSALGQCLASLKE
jgi:phosphotransferase system HPr (HPr) family protein